MSIPNKQKSSIPSYCLSNFHSNFFVFFISKSLYRSIVGQLSTVAITKRDAILGALSSKTTISSQNKSIKSKSLQTNSRNAKNPVDLAISRRSHLDASNRNRKLAATAPANKPSPSKNSTLSDAKLSAQN